MVLKLISTVFRHQGKIPRKFTGEGDDVSPPFLIESVPEKTKSLVLVCHDPDAPLVKEGRLGFVHWVLYDIPGETKKIEENTKAFKRGINDAKKLGYTGPMPPRKHGKHRYYFTLLALDKTLKWDKDLSAETVLRNAQKHVLEMARCVGSYKRN